ncbi:hypothetical protein Leryth_013255, partial [Lithospermum erythrorhizon]
MERNLCRMKRQGNTLHKIHLRVGPHMSQAHFCVDERTRIRFE